MEIRAHQDKHYKPQLAQNYTYITNRCRLKKQVTHFKGTTYKQRISCPLLCG